MQHNVKTIFFVEKKPKKSNAVLDDWERYYLHFFYPNILNHGVIFDRVLASNLHVHIYQIYLRPRLLAANIFILVFIGIFLEAGVFIHITCIFLVFLLLVWFGVRFHLPVVRMEHSSVSRGCIQDRRTGMTHSFMCCVCSLLMSFIS